MSRLLVHVEGQTEETFVNEVLRPYLLTKGYHSASARIVGNARQRDRRGGIKPWESVKRDILRHLKEDPACIATTMVDYYGLPADDLHGWPGRAAARLLPAETKAAHVETALLNAITESLGGVQHGFIPFVVMHEVRRAPLQRLRGFQPRHRPTLVGDGPATRQGPV